ncbi:hypothetical protein ElyMa_006901900 [Elysia marginata]|uniref:Uncharacterized protein n=1 Tax=Elysia marginata TaxID=1093978 RepID=A0AAV4JGM1_9GAST|nr:hypothetical protein ElyMa_006901900 [Elysia marginata]
MRPTRYPGSSGPRAYCPLKYQDAILGLPVQEPTVYHYTNMLPWILQSKGPLSSIRLRRYPGPSAPRSYCLPLDQHATLGFPV